MKFRCNPALSVTSEIQREARRRHKHERDSNCARSVIPSDLRRLAGGAGFSCARSGRAPLGKTESVTPLMEQTVGIWNVQQRMWTGPDAKALDLPPAVASRRLIGNAYLEEAMEPARASEQAQFTRTAYLNYNAINRQYEYFSLDSRAPQMMSYVAPGANKTREGKVELSGGVFVAPEWGKAKNAPFIYRLTVGEVKDSRQIVQLFLTEQSVSGVSGVRVCLHSPTVRDTSWQGGLTARSSRRRVATRLDSDVRTQEADEST